jgi:hypothetical protein
MASNRSAATASRIGLTRPFVAKLPRLGTLAYAASRLPGGKWTFIDFARLCQDECIKALVYRWDTLSHYDQRRTSLEALCEAMGIEPARLLGEVVAAAYQYNQDVSNLVAAVIHPKVVQASIDRALEPEGIDDRRFQFQHSGFLPSPRGPAVNVYNSLRPTVAVNAPENSGLPRFEDGVIAISSMLRGESDLNRPCATHKKSD